MPVIATAGHVDHGKSTLVRALTGMEPDRFAEERRRGLTLDLGFAWLTLPSGRPLSFVDVPGHERFIATMLAGLGPVPVVLFVVAADGGWSRQSAEHLAAVDALDVRHGLLAVTRSDLADPEPTRAEALEKLAASSLGPVPSVVVSGRTGAGLGDLRAALDDLVAELPEPDPHAPIRLWVDRSFSVKGAGTVVTGTLAAGTVAVGDRLELDGTPATVRGLQSRGRAHEQLRGTERVALNLRGVRPGDVGRGAVLLTPACWHRTDVIDARLVTTQLPAELVLHAGTAAVPARLRPLDARHVRITLQRALPLRAGDRAVLRDPSRHAVASSVLVLDADPPGLRRRGAARARAAALARAVGRPDTAAEIARRGAVPRSHLERLGVDTAGLVDEAGWLVDPDLRERWVAGAAGAVAQWAADHPLEPAMPLAALARAVGVPSAVLGGVVRDAELTVTDGRVGSARPQLGAGVRTLLERLAVDPFRAPQAEELAALGLGRRELAAAERSGALMLVNGIVLAPQAPTLAVEQLRTLGRPFTLSDARQALKTTRRVAVPLLEQLDREGRTKRLDGVLRVVVDTHEGYGDSE